MIDHEVRELRLSIDKLNRLIEKQLRQRDEALRRWRDANPKLSRDCNKATRALNEALSRLIETIIETTENPDETLNEFMLYEFIDKYGPGLAHLYGMIQLFAQLGG